ncbi:MAG: CDP-alcohol phosphatidyltransferase family protein [Candidatus Electrothrix aestuarii]|uniref:CDP-alcohol phosphatidyltransferase family protein n=1 Tax=Candidatus Electrothrix aestuarii TaxID=3062594 RepID=A0AAU8LT14_9BACT|nr:CDP-alcohol phosphatidyltransferase family protein [Candidatus Electrothrix aestuarii]WPD21103.1 MAG: CDP-alcohol phosphatidyltransferase family protein [Candidatus Electrothrix sp. GW3-3]
MEQFGGDKKVGRSLLTGPETWLKNWAIPKISPEIQTYHLTLTTLLWSFINILVAFEAKEHIGLLWLVSLMILFQYLTDLFDGELGRQRDTGLIKWGFYMDHFLDYIFLCSLVFVGYMISPEGLEIWYFALLVILGGFMVNSFLAFGATNEFQIYHYGVGPTEMRVVFILINIYIIYCGTSSFNILLPITVILCLIGLIVNTLEVHRKLWRHDMQVKAMRKEQVK